LKTISLSLLLQLPLHQKDGKKVGFTIHYTYQEDVYQNLTATYVNVEIGY